MGGRSPRTAGRSPGTITGTTKWRSTWAHSRGFPDNDDHVVEAEKAVDRQALDAEPLRALEPVAIREHGEPVTLEEAPHRPGPERGPLGLPGAPCGRPENAPHPVLLIVRREQPASRRRASRHRGDGRLDFRRG